MLLKNVNGCNLYIETEECLNPPELTCITFTREMKNGDKVIQTHNFSMHLTQQEIQALKEAL
jgi:hypothetical protein